MKRASRAVSRLLRGLGIADEVARAAALDAWPAAAAAVFGPDASATHAVAVEGETIVVTVPTSAWASEIRLRGADLTARIRQGAPGSDIRRVRCVPASHA